MKLLAFDVDGTLLGHDEILKESTIRSIDERLALGDAVSIVSGRPYNGIMPFLSRFGAGQKFPIGANGAAVYDYDGRLLMVQGLRYGDFASFYRRHKNLASLGAEIYCYTLDKVGYFGIGPFTKWELVCNDIGGIDLNQEPLAEDAPLLKFMIAWEHPDWSKLALTPEEKERYHIIKSDPRFLEFTSPLADKGDGVDFLRKYLGIAEKDVYCFGDEGNDVGMIARFQGVAMGNGIAECKRAAKFVTKSADEDGVSYALAHFVPKE